MGRYSSIAVVAITLLAITGCSSEGGEQTSNPTPTTAASPAANPTPTPATTPATSTSSATTQPFNNPVVPAKPQTPGMVAVANPNLIQSTNPTERAVVVAKGRLDPFGQILPSSLPVVATATPTTPTNAIPPRRPIPEVPPLPASRVTTVSTRSFVPRTRSGVISASIPFVPSASRIPKKAIASRLPKPITPARGFTPVLPRVMPQVVPNPSLVSVLPPTPVPELARGIAVTGVMMVGREPQAIVKVPNEPTSRYVEAGDRLSGGLLVKRIEMNEGSEPVVIFEQFGIEVARMVGEGPITPATTASADNAVPPPPNVPTGAS